MKNARFTLCLFALLIAMSANACGPVESLPPVNDAGVRPDGGDAGDSCAGMCVPAIQAAWTAPALVWVGAKADAPPCSVSIGAPAEFFTGYGNPDQPLCGACKCEKPTGSCKLPATLTAAAASCAGDGSEVAHTSFDPPASWDGTCTTSNPIPAGTLCGGLPCVQSITITPLTLKQSGCLPIEPAKNPPPTWKTFVRACVLNSATQTCGTMGEACAPQPPSPEFRICTLQSGDPATIVCPSGYPTKSVFYDSPVPDCSPCTCGVPMGSRCEGSISLFQNGACGAPPLQAIKIDSKGPTCADLPPGAALASKTASDPTFHAGSCEASSTASQATVFCCIP
jgi:hypothetical protein